LRKVITRTALILIIGCIVMTVFVRPVAARPIEPDYYYDYEYVTISDAEELWIDQSDRSMGKVRLTAYATFKYTYRVSIYGRQLIRIQWHELELDPWIAKVYWDFMADGWRTIWCGPVDMELSANIRNGVDVRYSSGSPVTDDYLSVSPNIICHVWDVAHCNALYIHERYDGTYDIVSLEVAFIYR